ncbi:MAG TPA: DinB family protein [Acidisarcina sp.]
MAKSELQMSAADSLLRTFDIHSRITVYLLQNLDPQCWHAPTPDGKGRDIAGLVCHIHSVHCMWLKAAASATIPVALDKSTVTQGEAISALEQSATLLRTLVGEALSSGVRLKNFKPDAVAFVGYLIAHDSHHRGQISMLARQSGFPLAKTANFGLWEWGTR